MSQPPGQKVLLEALGKDPKETIAALRLETQNVPTPGPGEVVLRVRAATVGWVDLLMLSGQYQHVPEAPYTPGLEFAGELHSVGEGVPLEVGTRVVADGFRTGPRSKGEHRRHGGFATYALAPAEAVFPIPGPLDFAEAANLLGNYETAYHCLVARGRIQPGEWVMIHGATGATGLAAVHLAKRRGAKVIATGRHRQKLLPLLDEGADHILPLLDDEGQLRRFRDEVKSLTEGRGVDVVYDSVGGPISLESLRCVSFGARYLIVGWAATPDAGRKGAANQLPTNLIMMKGLDVLGCPTVITTHRDPSVREQRIKDLFAWAEEGTLKPKIAARYPLGSFREALLEKWESKRTGGIVLEP